MQAAQNKASLSKSYYGDACKAWRPLSERASYQKNLDACYDGSTYESPDECMEFQRWIKEEIESNNIYYALSKYKGTQRLLFIRLKFVQKTLPYAFSIITLAQTFHIIFVFKYYIFSRWEESSNTNEK